MLLERLNNLQQELAAVKQQLAAAPTAVPSRSYSPVRHAPEEDDRRASQPHLFDLSMVEVSPPQQGTGAAAGTTSDTTAGDPQADGGAQQSAALVKPASREPASSVPAVAASVDAGITAAAAETPAATSSAAATVGTAGRDASRLVVGGTGHGQLAGDRHPDIKAEDTGLQHAVPAAVASASQPAAAPVAAAALQPSVGVSQATVVNAEQPAAVSPTRASSRWDQRARPGQRHTSPPSDQPSVARVGDSTSPPTPEERPFGSPPPPPPFSPPIVNVPACAPPVVDASSNYALPEPASLAEKARQATAAAEAYIKIMAQRAAEATTQPQASTAAVGAPAGKNTPAPTKGPQGHGSSAAARVGKDSGSNGRQQRDEGHNNKTVAARMLERRTRKRRRDSDSPRSHASSRDPDSPRRARRSRVEDSPRSSDRGNKTHRHSDAKDKGTALCGYTSSLWWCPGCTVASA